MVLTAHATREGEPVACAYGCFPTGDAVGAGFLFVREGIADGRLDFTDPATGNTYRLALPPNALNLPDDAYFIETTLEFAHDEP